MLLIEESAKMSFKLHIWITTGRVRAVGEAPLLLFPTDPEVHWTASSVSLMLLVLTTRYFSEELNIIHSFGQP